MFSLDLISETLMFHCCFVDDYLLMTSWRDIFEFLISSMEIVLTFIVFVVLTSESLMFHCCFIGDSWMILWRTIEFSAKIPLQTLTIRNVFFWPSLRNIDISLLLRWRFVDDSLERHIWNLDKFDFECKFWSLMFLFCNFWITDVSLLVLWRFVDDSLKIHWRYKKEFDAIINDLQGFYWPILRYSDDSLLLRQLFVDDTLKRDIWNLDIFDGNFFDLFCFCCVNIRIIHVSLLLHWWFVVDPLKIHWRYSEDFNASINELQWFFDLISETSLFPCCFVDDSLMIIWRDIFEALIISMETFWSLLFLLC